MVREYFWKFKKPLGLGVLALALVDVLDVLPPLIIRQAVNALEKGEGYTVLLWMAVAFLVAAAFQGLFRYFWRKYFIGTSHLTAYDLRGRLYKHLQGLSYAFFSRSKTGDLMSRLTNDIDEIRQMFGIGFLLLMDALFYFMSVPFIMLWMSPTLTMYVLIPLPAIPLFVVYLGRWIHERSLKVQERLADLSAKCQENFSGIRVVKAFRKEDAEIRTFGAQNRGLLGDNLRLAALEAGFHPALELAMGIGIFMLIYSGGHRAITGEITIGDFVAFQAYLLKMVWPMTAIGLTMNLYQRGLASMSRSAEILAEKPEVSDSPGAESDHPIRGDIEFRDLCFSYPGASQPALDHVSFRLPAGRTLGLVGPVGSGKTSLLHLLLRLYDVPPGKIFLDGRDIREYPIKSLREAFGFVPQDNFLFSETVFENIAFGMRGKPDPAKAEECAKIAQIADEIHALPDGMETLLGERGVNLSGGQKQRVSLARALARDPVVLIMDDATSAVDTDTEERLVRDLAWTLNARTGIIVSHRLVSVQHADLIVYLNEGRVVETGSHQELLEAGGAYFRMWEKQKIRTELELDVKPEART